MRFSKKTTALKTKTTRRENVFFLTYVYFDVYCFIEKKQTRLKKIIAKKS
tara:strand:- start:570 stop:719 length:150 start_codon:yes stop_codon:yes gene_type:complete